MQRHEYLGIVTIFGLTRLVVSVSVCVCVCICAARNQLHGQPIAAQPLHPNYFWLTIMIQQIICILLLWVHHSHKYVGYEIIMLVERLEKTRKRQSQREHFSLNRTSLV